jgi:hypothetical protein
MDSLIVIYTISPSGNFVGFLKNKPNVIGQAKSLDGLKVSIYKSYLSLEKYNSISKEIKVSTSEMKAVLEPSVSYLNRAKEWIDKVFKTETNLLQSA